MYIVCAVGHASPTNTVWTELEICKHLLRVHLYAMHAPVCESFPFNVITRFGSLGISCFPVNKHHPFLSFFFFLTSLLLVLLSRTSLVCRIMSLYMSKSFRVFI